MRAVDLIRTKRDGGRLDRAALDWFVAGVTDGSIPDYQASALLMAIVVRGMTADETAALTDAMVRSGVRVEYPDLPGVGVDKHSTGGDGAFMKTEKDARALAESLVATGELAGVRTEALLTDMDAPLGRAVGNALEIVESIETLKGRGPADLESLSVEFAARMLVLGGIEPAVDRATARVRKALSSGAGLEKLREIIANQGGDP